MKFFSGFMALLFAIMISGVSGYFSVVGLAALFAATFWPVVMMGSFLEGGKLVAAAWLHANWRNSNVNWMLKTYLSMAIVALMLITGIGIYGFLSKGHLEQEAPVAGTQLQIERKMAQIEAKKIELDRLKARQAQLDAAVQSLIDQKFVVNSQKLRDQQKTERAQIITDQTSSEKEISRLTDEILPLKLANTEVAAKLGPVKYVADLFGWKDTNAAVRLVILILMFAFDPLAVVLVLASTISFGEWVESRRKKTPEIVPVQNDIIIKDMKTPIPVMAVGDPESDPDSALIGRASLQSLLNKDEWKEPIAAHEPIIQEPIVPVMNVEQPIVVVEKIEPEIIPSVISEYDLSWNNTRTRYSQILEYIPPNVEITEYDLSWDATRGIIKPQISINDDGPLLDLLDKRPELVENFIDVISEWKERRMGSPVVTNKIGGWLDGAEFKEAK